jgi:F0F1-type ATP synthase epsilon subunit
MSDIKIINVKVRDTENVLYEGEIDRISSFNEVGPFDIYPMHANFISIINTKVTLYNKKKVQKELTFEQAVMKVKKDIAHIYLGVEMFFIENDDDDKDDKEDKKDAKK